MKTVTFIAQKGGTSKTTLTVCLAVLAYLAKKKVLVVDLDPQSSACQWSDQREEHGIVVIDAQPGRLGAAIKKAADSGFDFCFIDTPGKSEQAAVAAAREADLVIVALKPQIYDLATIPETQQLIAMAGNKPAVILFTQVPPPSHEGISSRWEEAAKAVGGYGIPVLPEYLCNRVDFGDAAKAGLTPTEYNPEGRSAQEIRQIYKSINRLLDKVTK